MGTSFEIRCKVGFCQITKESLVTVYTVVYIELALVYASVLTWIFGCRPTATSTLEQVIRWEGDHSRWTLADRIWS